MLYHTLWMNSVLVPDDEKATWIRVTRVSSYGRQHWYAAESYKLWRLVRWAGTTGFESLAYYHISGYSTVVVRHVANV